METYEVLEKALAEVQKGWCQYALEDGAGNVCALGGIRRVDVGAALSMENRSEAVEEAKLALGRAMGSPIGFVSQFNNSHSKDEVEDRFREAIRNEKAKVGISVDLPEPVPTQVLA